MAQLLLDRVSEQACNLHQGEVGAQLDGVQARLATNPNITGTVIETDGGARLTA